VRLVTTRNNQRLFRVAWSILKDRGEAEDAVQSAYLKAFDAIRDFEGRSSLATWLTRIVINEALARLRATRRRRAQLDGASVTVLDDYREKLMCGSQSGTLPDVELALGQVRGIIERAIAALPDNFRLVFVMREIEGLSVEDTADMLGVKPGTVKTRHLRARRRLQEALAPELKTVLSGTFPFAGIDCARLSERVVKIVCGEPADQP
jgi:RNA polymerase sigma-70 factor (ECF subfamily)